MDHKSTTLAPGGLRARRTASLPASIDSAAYGALRADPERWIDIVSGLAELHHLDASRTRPVAEGSNLVALLGDHSVVKIFPPFLRHQHESERLVLSHLRGRLQVAIPEILGDDEISGWPYLVMTQLEGVPLLGVWPACTHDERRAILYAIGRLIAEVEAVPCEALSILEPEWTEFMASQALSCARRHEHQGFALWSEIDRYLERTAHALPASFRPVLLTGEYTPDNVLMRRRDDAWQIAGLIDFGDAIVGFGEYDLLGPSTFLAGGDAQPVRALLAGFGHSEPASLRGLSHHLMRMLLLHRFSDFRVQVCIDGWQDRARTIDDLRRMLWPLDDDG